MTKNSGVLGVPAEALHRPKDIMFRGAFFALTGDFFQALVLGQFTYYQLAARDFEDFVEEENKREAQRGHADWTHVDLTGGWFWKSANELCEELMRPFKRSRAREIIQTLTEKGWVMARQNPVKKTDRTKHYRLDLVKIFYDLEALGHALPGWNPEQIKNLEKRAAVRRLFISAERKSIPVGRQSISTSRKTIPEGTSEGTAEIPTPKPSSGAEEGFSSSLIFNSKPGGSGAPQINKQIIVSRDWWGQVENDKPAWELFGTLFPKSEFPAQDPQLAKKFVKARQGVLTDRALKLLVSHYRDARVDGVDASEWKVRDYHSFLKPRHLQQAIPRVEQYLREELMLFPASNIDATDNIELAEAHVADVNRAFKASCVEGIRRCITDQPDHIPAVLAYCAAMRVTYNDPGLDRGRLLQELSENIGWVIFCRRYSISFEGAFGISEEEAIRLHREYIDPWVKELEELHRFLGKEYKLPNFLKND